MSEQHPGFNHLWQQEELSDVQLLLAVEGPAAAEGDASPASNTTQHEILQVFPVHTAILTCSPFFRAQVIPLEALAAAGKDPARLSPLQVCVCVCFLPHIHVLDTVDCRLRAGTRSAGKTAPRQHLPRLC
jgi:hypothetical protein